MLTLSHAITERRSARGRRCDRRRGLTVAELLISAMLLIALVSIVVPLGVRAGRLWQEARAYRLALNELSNQLENLTLLGDQEREQALAGWKPDELLLHALPEACLTGEVLDDDDGKRLRLSLNWRRLVESPPLTLIGWLHPVRVGDQDLVPSDTGEGCIDPAGLVVR